MNTDPIDSRELPFSEDEFFRAFCLVENPDVARDLVDQLVRTVREVAEAQVSVQNARARGSMDPEELREPVWMISDEAFALLRLVSEELKARVEAYMRERWESERESLTYAHMYRAGRVGYVNPSSSDVAAIDASIASYAGEWAKVCERMRRAARHTAIKRRQKPTA